MRCWGLLGPEHAEGDVVHRRDRGSSAPHLPWTWRLRDQSTLMLLVWSMIITKSRGPWQRQRARSRTAVGNLPDPGRSRYAGPRRRSSCRSCCSIVTITGFVGLACPTPQSRPRNRGRSRCPRLCGLRGRRRAAARPPHPPEGTPRRRAQPRPPPLRWVFGALEAPVNVMSTTKPAIASSSTSTITNEDEHEPPRSSSVAVRRGLLRVFTSTGTARALSPARVGTSCGPSTSSCVGAAPATMRPCPTFT